MKSVYTKFGLEATTQDFIGHAMALYTTDEYLNTKGRVHETLERIKLYATSMQRYGNGKSPYIYPLYGLGELPQGFARLSAIYGGTYMLNTDVDEFIEEGGKVVGIKATMKHDDGPGMKFETKAKRILADPSYFPSKVRVTGHLIKAIHILREPEDEKIGKDFLPFVKKSDSMQLIIPQSQVGRKNGKSRSVLSERKAYEYRHLRCHPWCCPKCCSQGVLHRHRLHHCRERCQSSRRGGRWQRSTWCRALGDFHGFTYPTL